MELAKNLNRKAFRFGIFWNPVRLPGSPFALDWPWKSVEFGSEGRGLAYGLVWGPASLVLWTSHFKRPRAGEAR
jgi:hypothetical protein